MTRIAVISDIHGNCVALDIALADIERAGVDQIVCLGDAIQGGAQPAQTVARLREFDCLVVMGNADAWHAVRRIETGSGRHRRREEPRARVVTRAALRGRPRLHRRLRPDRHRSRSRLSTGLLCFHGTPASFDEVILPTTPEEECARLPRAIPPAIMCGGHTHWQQIRRLDATFFFNPGSVGLAYNHPKARGPGFRARPLGRVRHPRRDRWNARAGVPPRPCASRCNPPGATRERTPQRRGLPRPV